MATKIGAVDAKPDKATDAALADFRKRMNMAAAGNAVRPVRCAGTEALKKTAPAGYTVCNDSDKAVLVALAQNDGGKLVRAAGGRSRPAPAPRPSPRRSTPTRVYLLAQTPGGVPLVERARQVLHHQRRVRNPGPRQLRRARAWRSRLCRHDARALTGYVAHIGDQQACCTPARLSRHVEIAEMPAHLVFASAGKPTPPRAGSRSRPAVSSRSVWILNATRMRQMGVPDQRHDRLGGAREPGCAARCASGTCASCASASTTISRWPSPRPLRRTPRRACPALAAASTSAAAASLSKTARARSSSAARAAGGCR